MTDEKNDEEEPAQTRAESDRDVKGRFVSGAPSANPKGRPPKVTEDPWDIAARIFREKITFSEKGGKRKRSANEGIFVVARNKALNGEPRALAQYFKSIRPELDKRERERRAKYVEDGSYKILLCKRIEDMAAKYEAEQAAKKKEDEERARKVGTS